MSTAQGVRTWTETGEKLYDRELADRQGHNWAAGREVIERAIEGLTWHDVPDTGIISGPMSPVSMLGELIEQLRLPKVTRYAYDGLVPTRSCEGSNCYSLLAIECNYSNGRCLVYAVDRGVDALVMASDFFERPA